MAFPGGASGKEPTCQCRSERCGFDPWVGKIPWRRAWQPTPVLLSRESHRQRSLVGYSPWGRKESDMTEKTQYEVCNTCSLVFHATFKKVKITLRSPVMKDPGPMLEHNQDLQCEDPLICFFNTIPYCYQPSPPPKFTENFLWASHCAKYFSCVISYNPH